jgi:hypothetical protein
MSTLKTNNVQVGQSVTATNNFTLYQPATPDGTVRLGVGNTGATTADVITATSAGNVGLGVTPNAWTGGQALQVGARSGFIYRTDLTSTEVSNNTYYTSGSGYLYQASAAATLYRQSSGAHSWFNASSGTAGNVVGYTQAMTLDSSGNLQFNSGYGSVATAYGCRAWVNFNGTGTVAIRASGNVTSITDNSTGNYTVNFTTAMPDVNYSAVLLGKTAGNTDYEGPVTYSTGSFRFELGRSGVGPIDQTNVNVAIFR